jgi:hypothetical protein
MKKIVLITLLAVLASMFAGAVKDVSIAASGMPGPIGNVIQRQVFAEAPNERFILTQTRVVVPTGNQSCGNGNCNTRINSWEMVTAEPLYFLASSVKVTCNEKLKKHCELFGGYQIGNITDRSITFTTMDKSPDYQMGYGLGATNSYTLSANLMIKEPKTKKGVFNPQDFYAGLKFYVNVADSALETELIGYHKKYGPFLIDPLNFSAGFGIKKLETEVYPGGKRITFIVENEKE